MKKVVLLQTAVITILLPALMSVLFGSANQPLADVVLADQGNVSDEGQSIELAQFGGESDEVPPPVVAPTAVDALNAEPTTLVYFTPQDSDGTGTAVSLYNTTAVTRTVNVKGFSAAGSLTVNVNVAVGPNALVHLVSDSLAAPTPPSWTGSVFTNFTDFTTYASLALPQGIKVDGNVVFNPSTGTIDPRADQGAIPLRFSTDPLTVFLPAVKNSP